MADKVNNKRTKIIAALCAVLAVILIAVIAYAYREGRAPDSVEGLCADTGYSRVTLTWEPAERAAGYKIYAADVTDGSGFTPAGETEGADNCEFVYNSDPEHEYQFRVAGYSRNMLTRRSHEGMQSEPVTAVYASEEYAQMIPVLAYHNVVPTGQKSSGLNVSEDVLEEELRYLHDNGYTTLTLDEFYEWHEGKREVPVKSVVITFDDGYYGTYYLAYPIFRKYDMAATVFCIGQYTGETTEEFDPDYEKYRYVGKDVIDKVRSEYPKFAFESHTYGMHVRINGRKPLWIISYDDMMEDFAKNAQYDYHYLAYPWGANNKKLRKAAKNSGIKMAFTYRPFYYAERSDKTYKINRIKIEGGFNLNEFARIVSCSDEEYINTHESSK